MNTQIQKASEIGISTRKLNSGEPKEEKREYNIPQGRRKSSFGKNNKQELPNNQRGGKEMRKIERGRT